MIKSDKKRLKLNFENYKEFFFTLVGLQAIFVLK